MKFTSLKLVATFVLLAALTACGGGSTPGDPEVLLQPHPVASNAGPMDTVVVPARRMAASAHALDASSFLNWAESAYPALFEAPQSNSTIDVWTYRYYPKTDIYLATNTSGDVLGLVGKGGGEYNSHPLGKITDFGCLVYPSDCNTINAAPIANAGTAQSTYLGDLITLDGSASSDANGDALTYAWTIRSFPSLFAPTISSANTARPTFTVRDAGTYVFALVVNDGRVSSIASIVTVTVGSGVEPTSTGSGLVVQNTFNFWTLDEATLTKRVDFSCGVNLGAIDRRPDGVIVGTSPSQLYEINPVAGVCSARGTTPEWIKAVAVSASGQVFGMSFSQVSRPDGNGVGHRLHKLSNSGASQSYAILSGASTYVTAIDFGPDGQLYGLGITPGGNNWSIVRINPETGVTTVAVAMPVVPTGGDIDIDSSGVLRTMIDGNLCKININTGALLSSTPVPNFQLGYSSAAIVYVP